MHYVLEHNLKKFSEEELRERLTFANVGASIITTRKGALRVMPTMEEIEREYMKNTLHLKAPGNWINDPNGFIYYKGQYHLFYQYFPYAPMWGTMHWGHAVSEDLIHWQHLGIALYPTKSYDCNGVFSGSAIEIEGRLHIYYTAARYVEENPENIHQATEKGIIQSQVMIVSEDGFSFDNIHGKQLVLPEVTDHEIGDEKECRDPKVWKEGDTYYMCLASTYYKKEGVLLIYESKDGVNWTLNSRVQDKSLGIILECPDLFEIDGKQVLISSPIDILAGTEFLANQAICRFVFFDAGRKVLNIEKEYTFFDYGMELYAPQSNLDEEGRRVVIAWVRMPHPFAPSNNTAANGLPWNGMMSLPRVVSIRAGHLYTSVHPNVRRFFEESACVETREIVCPLCDGNATPKAYKEKICAGNRQIFATLCEGESLDVHGFIISLKEGCVCTDRSRIISGESGLHHKSQTPYVGASCELEIYIDLNLIEVFINDGQYVISNVVENIQHN